MPPELGRRSSHPMGAGPKPPSSSAPPPPGGGGGAGESDEARRWLRQLEVSPVCPTTVPGTGSLGKRAGPPPAAMFNTLNLS